MRISEITKQFTAKDMMDVKVLQCYNLQLLQYISNLQDQYIEMTSKYIQSVKDCTALMFQNDELHETIEALIESAKIN